MPHKRRVFTSYNRFAVEFSLLKPQPIYIFYEHRKSEDENFDLKIFSGMHRREDDDVVVTYCVQIFENVIRIAYGEIDIPRLDMKFIQNSIFLHFYSR
jgi:hypothetical protein